MLIGILSSNLCAAICSVTFKVKKIFDVSPIGFIRNVTDKTGRGGGYLYMLGGRV